MTSIELSGWAASALTLVAFTSRNLQRLRLASVGPSVAFIVFAATTAAWPVLALHALLLPISLRRLLELQTTSWARPWLCACGGRPVWLTMALLATPVPGGAASATHAERMHTRAVDSFRQGRFSEAYGRFVELANLQHRDSARYAMWMCEHGPALFGKQWDCAPHEMEDWARSANAGPPPAPSKARMNAPTKRRTRPCQRGIDACSPAASGGIATGAGPQSAGGPERTTTDRAMQNSYSLSVTQDGATKHV